MRSALCYNPEMFGLTKPKLAVTPEQQRWVDSSFLRLATILGSHRILQAKVILPTPDHFPDPYDGSEAALQLIFQHVATAMQVDPSGIEVTMFAAADDISKRLIPFWEGPTSGAAGLYHHDPTTKPHISINEKQLKDPMALVAVLAHELGHIILLRPGLVPRDDPDMEPMNDLLTVFLGFGIFTANSAFYFKQYTSGRTQGWSAGRLGYLSEEMFGYALARFAFERGEAKPTWRKFLSTNVSSYLKRSAAWLADRNEPRLFG
jgi:hypothetical protein